MANRIIASSYPMSRLGRGLYLSPEDGGGAGGGTGGEGGAGGGEGKPDEVIFTPAQIAKIGEINAKERNAAKANGAKEAITGLLGELGVKDLDELKAKLTGKPADTPKGAEKADDDAKLAEILARRDGEWKPKLSAAEQRAEAAEKALADMKAARVNDAKRAALMDAAVKAKAVDPSIVAQLCGDAISVSEADGRFVFTVAGEGGPKLNAKGDPMSPEEFVAAYIADRPFLAAGSGTSGGGSKPNTPGTKSTAADLQAQIDAANKAGNTVLAVRLRRDLHALETAQR